MTTVEDPVAAPETTTGRARPWLLAALAAAAVVLLVIAALVVTSRREPDPAAHPPPGHAHPGGEAAPPDDDKGLSLIMNGQGEGGGHTHHHADAPLDAATQARLDAQLAKLRPFIEQFPTVKDAEAAGYTRQGPFSPGLGTHYMKPASASSRSELMDDDALGKPFLIYDGTAPDSKLAGFMFTKLLFDPNRPPEGFAGPNDHWHYHTDVCLVPRPEGGFDTPLGADTKAPKELCDRYPGGRLIPNTGYMVHVWPVPGYESPQGLFSNTNAAITCPNGTYYTIDLEQIGTRRNVCRDVDE